jgi:hypothetical protein
MILSSWRFPDINKQPATAMTFDLEIRDNTLEAMSDFANPQ